MSREAWEINLLNCCERRRDELAKETKSVQHGGQSHEKEAEKTSREALGQGGVVGKALRLADGSTSPRARATAAKIMQRDERGRSTPVRLGFPSREVAPNSSGLRHSPVGAEEKSVAGSTNKIMRELPDENVVVLIKAQQTGQKRARSTPIEVQQTNPKRAGSKSAARFERYKAATTLGEYYDLGGTVADANYDRKKGFLTARPSPLPKLCVHNLPIINGTSPCI